MPPLAVIVVLALATYRVTRLCTADKITLPVREAIFSWAYKPLTDTNEIEAWALLHPEADEIPSHVPRGWEIRTWLYELVTCDQCLGVWWGAAVYCAWRFGIHDHGTVWEGILTVAALCGLQSLLAWLADVMSKESEALKDA